MKRTACVLLLGLPLGALAQVTPLPGTPTQAPPDGFRSVTRPANPATDGAPADADAALANPPQIRAGTFVNGTGTGTAGTGIALGAGTSTVPGSGIGAGVTPGVGAGFDASEASGPGIAPGAATVAANGGVTPPATGTLGNGSPATGGLATGATSASEVRIRSAMSAAPAAISASAAVMEWPASAGAQMTTLRSGNNGWTCFPDKPGTPGNDPMCLDRQWMAWLDGYLNRRAPVITGTGIAYLLQGGSDASSTDPFASAPAAGQTWLTTPAHIRVLSPQRWDTTIFGDAPGVEGTAPWILFATTPWEHLVVPVPSVPGAAGSPAVTPAP